MVHILKCTQCESYGLDELCTCGSKRIIIIPPKFSPEDKYAKYRRQAKEQENE
ncbi:ribosome biogenesis protein [Candidatus Woesearchaeota archaeon CG10_big_fil_rev_8_21_14_0_10_32_9]|nr:MAG: ribosome biogenesis protein [Candidatus Woesearchaeota archaeon CG10_big_fil_rev_8_21_14_0_10_32_9]